ncbi:MAG: hypothetical protein GY913_26745 [Proteobacteria bacterium]|nr:hypothetical protein [Pseudomonadota bacterium]MCP4920513.1 hypothetical protein [Pseudomonadota bacterium]
MEPPVRLGALLSLLVGDELEICDPRDRAGLHPLLVPLARDENTTTALLRWPTPSTGHPLPLVRAGSRGMSLLALSADQWLHKELATRDADGDDAAGLARAVNRDEVLYEPGTLALSNLPLKAYLLLKVGGLPELYYELALRHEEKGDEMAACVTADRCTTAIPDFGEPHVFRTALLDRLGRHDSARESARAALTLPLWTLGAPFEAVALKAGWAKPVTSARFHEAADDTTKPVLDRAAHRMDAIAVEEGDWDAARPELAALFREGGLEQLADFVSPPA